MVGLESKQMLFAERQQQKRTLVCELIRLARTKLCDFINVKLFNQLVNKEDFGIM